MLKQMTFAQNTLKNKTTANGFSAQTWNLQKGLCNMESAPFVFDDSNIQYMHTPITSVQLIYNYTIITIVFQKKPVVSKVM